MSFYEWYQQNQDAAPKDIWNAALECAASIAMASLEYPDDNYVSKLILHMKVGAGDTAT